MKSARRPWLAGLLCAVGLWASGLAAPLVRETVAVITELTLGKGRVEVKGAGAAGWRSAGPLLALGVGDAVRATADAHAIVLLSGGRGTARVDAAHSPYVVGAPAGASKIEKAQRLIEDSLAFLSATTPEPARAVLSTRGASRPLVILTPRNGPVLPGSVVFEWAGNPASRYTVRVEGPAGVLLERTGVVGARFAYPEDAPRLMPGVQYTFQVVALGQSPQETRFEIVDPARAQAVRQDLRHLDEALGAGLSEPSRTVLKAGALASQGLLHDAWLVVLAALAKRPDDPTLHTLLATLYLKTGLPEQAAEAFDEAQFLLRRGE